MKIDLSIIIVSFNTKDFLLDSIQSIYKTMPDKISFEIIVVDNASKDGSVEEARSLVLKNHKKNGKLVIIENRENLGFAKANNLGVKKAQGEYLLFLNPDTLIYPKTLEYMLDFMSSHPDCAGATCELKMQNGEIDYASHRGFPTPWNAFCYFSGLTRIFPRQKLFSGYTQGWKDLSQTHEVDCISGAFMLVRKTAGDECRWWDEDYFFNGEDIDFCFKLREKKWKIYYVPEVSILHYNGVAGGTKKNTQAITTADAQRKYFTNKQRFIAMKIFYDKHYRHQYSELITRLVYFGIAFKQRQALKNIKHDILEV